jgi:hypothetical protein
MIEAMACGTPVIAFPCGSVFEVLEDGMSGFIVDTIEEAVKAVRRTARLNRATVRAQFERRFTVERMAHDYLEIYHRATASSTHRAKTDRVNGAHLSPTMTTPARADDRDHLHLWSCRDRRHGIKT